MIAAAALVALSILPIARLLLPGACQPYRFAALALLLALVAGASRAGPCCAWLARRVRRPLGYAALGALWLGLGVRQAMAWPHDAEGLDPAAVIAAGGAAAPPAGARVLACDAIGWHRWWIDAWRDERGWEAAGSLHTPVLPPACAALADAADAIGCRQCAISMPMAPALDADAAAAVVRDAGITDCLRTRWLQHGPSGALPPAGWSLLRGGWLERWRIGDPAPRVEAVERLWAWTLPISAASRAELAAWWSAVRARDRLGERLVLARGGEPLAAGAIVEDQGGDPARQDGARRFSILAPPAAPRASALALRPGGGIAAAADAFSGALAGVEGWMRAQDRAHAGAATAARAAPRWRWSGDAALAIDGLAPGQPYLVRYAFSPRMRLDAGRLLEEAAGMTVMVPARASVVLRIEPMTWWLWAALWCSGCALAAGAAHLVRGLVIDRRLATAARGASARPRA